MTTKPRIWWASPCAGGTFYPDREEAELFGVPSFCAECFGYHVRDDGDGRDAPDGDTASPPFEPVLAPDAGDLAMPWTKAPQRPMASRPSVVAVDGGWDVRTLVR